MIRLGFMAALVLVVVSCTQTPKTTVKLYVDGERGDFSPKIITKDSTYEAAWDSTGTATFVLAENLKPDYAKLQYGRVVFPVYLEAGKSFSLDLKFDGRLVTPRFTGEGAKKNEYLNNSTLQRYMPNFKLDEEAFMVSLDNQVKSFYIALDSMGFDDSFNQIEKKRLHYMVYGVLTRYAPMRNYFAQNTNYISSEKFYDKLRTVISEDETLLGMPEYQMALSESVETLAAKDMEKSSGLGLINKLDYVNDKIQSPAISEYLVHKFVMKHIGYAGIDQLEEALPVYKAKVSDPVKKAEFEQLYDQWAKIAKGQPSPDFKYLDIDGKEVSSTDLAGKYVYIDVWATWCGPCRGELPHLKELEHQFQNRNIHFVSISCDQDKAAWEKMVKEDKLGGIQLHKGDDKSFMDAYIIHGIPRFILLDREGKIMAANMSRPSSPKTAATLKALEGI